MAPPVATRERKRDKCELSDVGQDAPNLPNLRKGNSVVSSRGAELQPHFSDSDVGEL